MIKVDSNVNKRRIRSLQRLEDQLKSGKKPMKVDGRTTDKKEDLTEKDIKRIEAQMTVLKDRIVKA